MVLNDTKIKDINKKISNQISLKGFRLSDGIRGTSVVNGTMTVCTLEDIGVMIRQLKEIRKIAEEELGIYL